MTEIRLGEYVFTLALDSSGKPRYAHTVVPPFPPQTLDTDASESALPPELTPYSFRDLSGGYGQAETPLRGGNTRFDRMGDAVGEGVDATLTPEGPLILSGTLNSFSLSPAGTNEFSGAVQNTGTVSHFTAGRYVYKWTGAALTQPGDVGAGLSPSDRITPFTDVVGTEYWYVPLGGSTTAKYSTDSGATWSSIGTGGGVDKVFSFAVVDSAVFFAGPSPRSGQAFLAQFDDGGTAPTLFGVIDPVGNPGRAISRLMEWNGRVVVLKNREGAFLLTSDQRDLSENLLPDLPTSGAVLLHHGATVWHGILWIPTGQTVVAVSPGPQVNYRVGPDVANASIQSGVRGVVQALSGDAYNLYAFLYTGSSTASWLLKANVTVSNSQVEKIAWFPFLQLGTGFQCLAMSTVGGVDSSSRNVTDLLVGNVTGSTYGVYRIRLPRQGRDPRADPTYTYASGGTLYYSRNTKRFPANMAQWYGMTPLCLDLGYKVDQITPTTAQSVATWYKEDTVPLVSTPPYGYTQNTAQTTGVGSRDTLTDLTAPRSVRARGLDTAIRLASTDSSTTPQVSSVTLDYMISPAPTWQHVFTIDLSSGAQETGGLTGLGALLPPDKALAIVRSLPGTATTLAMAPDQPDVTYSVAIPPNDGILPEVSGPPDAGYGGPGGMASVVPMQFTIRAIETAPVSRLVDTQRSYLQEVMADAPGGYWRLGENAGTTAADSSANANSGTYTAGYTLNQTGALVGDSNAAVLLNGTTGYVTIADAASLDLGDTFTLEAWVKRTGLGTTQTVLTKGSNAYALLLLSTNRFRLTRPGVGTIVDSTASGELSETGVWYHLVATKAGATSVLYFNGVDVTGTITNQTCVNNATALELGADGGANFLDGTLDEVAVYPTALSAARILAHYQAGSSVR